MEKVDIADEVTDVICEECGRNMVVKYGPHGKFLACPGFPECRNTKPYLEKVGVPCPKCGKDIVIQKPERAENIMAVKIILIVILCHGRSTITYRNVRNVVDQWLRRAIESYVWTMQCGYVEVVEKNKK